MFYFLINVGLTNMCIMYICIYINSPSQTQGGKIETNLSLETKSWRCPGGCVLVKISAVWSAKETDNSPIVPRVRWWRIKWQSISMCFMRSWNTSLWAIWIALWLSQLMIVEVEWVTPMFSSNQRSQRSSWVVSARARYSASVLDRTTTVCSCCTKK